MPRSPDRRMESVIVIALLMMAQAVCAFVLPFTQHAWLLIWPAIGVFMGMIHFAAVVATLWTQNALVRIPLGLFMIAVNCGAVELGERAASPYETPPGLGMFAGVFSLTSMLILQGFLWIPWSARKWRLVDGDEEPEKIYQFRVIHLLICTALVGASLAIVRLLIPSTVDPYELIASMFPAAIFVGCNLPLVVPCLCGIVAASQGRSNEAWNCIVIALLFTLIECIIIAAISGGANLFIAFILMPLFNLVQCAALYVPLGVLHAAGFRLVDSRDYRGQRLHDKRHLPPRIPGIEVIDE